MENKDTPAFPQSCCVNENGVYLATNANTESAQVVGLSKRELIAAMAMQGYLSNHELTTDTTPLEVTARDAVKQADALIAELSKTQP